MDRPTTRRHLIGAFALFHVVAVFLLATPDVRGGLSARAWKDPVVQRQLSQWRDGLAGVGIETTPEELQALIFKIGGGYHDARDKVLTPFAPYERAFGTRQPWRLFSGEHAYPSVLHIDVERGGAFEPIYVARSDEHTWRRPLFDDVRMRKLVYLSSWPHRQKHYQQLVDWIALEVVRDFPDATRVRVRRWRYKIPSAAEARAGQPIKGRFRDERVVDLGHEGGAP
jgi:hypothetical protein